MSAPAVTRPELPHPERDDDLMDQVFVVLTVEHGLGHIHLGRCLALFIQEFELH